jgi:allophanate hydrolase
MSQSVVSIQDLQSLAMTDTQAVLDNTRAKWCAAVAGHRDAQPDVAWISLATDEQINARLAALEQRGPQDLPLFGVPFAVKDNIDVAGWPTTAACPGFSTIASDTAPAVQALLDAGAVLIGKTNLDQFATGLVGSRSPYGAVPNPFSPSHISGGSSSGSASVLARGLVAFALGTDTAGSGRVPAGFNNLVGFKPSPGRVPTEGVLPAVQSIDVLSVFTLTPADAAIVYRIMASSRRSSQPSAHYHGEPRMRFAFSPDVRVGVPEAPVFQSDAYRTCFDHSLQHASGLGFSIDHFDMSALSEAARMLYDGPWVAERWAVAGEAITSQVSGLDPVVASVISRGRDFSAADSCRALYRLKEIAAQASRLWEQFDVLMVPTAPTIPTAAELAADPVGCNSALGVYTNFVNLLGWAAVASPDQLTPAGLPFGVTFIAPAGCEEALLRLAARWNGSRALPLGRALRETTPTDNRIPDLASGAVRLAVVGAHLRGMPLHREIIAAGGTFVTEAQTAPGYSLYALRGTVPPKPGLVRVSNGGVSIALEVFDIPVESFGQFVAGVPAPLGIGSVELSDGQWVKGFICEPIGLEGAQDISGFGGWRAYRAANA